MIGRPARSSAGGRLDAVPILALAVYSVAAFLMFGLRVVLAPRLSYVGTGVDPQIFIWSFAWWPHAVLHGLNPFITHAIWAPDGLNLAWTTSVPGLALLFTPVTLLAGPVTAFNVAAVLMPAAAAWTGFLLCRHLTGSTWPSLAGGYLFGFSSYMLGQQEGHLHLTSVFLIPLVALSIVRFLQGTIARRQLSLRLGLLFALQISFSTEVFFTLTLAIATGVIIAFVTSPNARQGLRALLKPLVAAYVLALMAAGPLVYYAISGFNGRSINEPRHFAADLLNLVVPTKLLLATLPERAVVAHFLGNDSERGAYLGLPVLIAVGMYARLRRSTASGRFLLLCLAVGVLAELGASLRVDGRRLVPLPLSLVDRLPLFDNVLPVRLSLYVSLVAAVIVAILAAASRSRWVRIALPLLAVITFLPNPGSRAWITEPGNPRFIADQIFRVCLPRGANTIVFPPGARGDSMLWQAESGFWFRMAGGYLSPVIPAAFRRFRSAHGALASTSTTHDILALARAKDAPTVIVDARHAAPWQTVIPGPPLEVAGVLIFRLPGSPVTPASCSGTRTART
ncbi:MAG TPA: hypothetical protein VNC40_10990 [Gaiellaceae bacterium]|nr:hypothetical protein [Gaiellaceae bacterium]